MKKIPLTQGKYALVDDSDYEIVNQWKWYAQKNGKTFYALSNPKMANGKRISIGMHRVIMKTPKGMLTDHIDGDGLNNQRSNLRICTPSENQMNKGKQSNNTSGFKGVHWNKKDKRWIARIRVNYKFIGLGLFTTKEDAYEAYIAACKKYHGEFANLGTDISTLLSETISNIQTK